ncbi:hypothetical protein O9X94_19065 [Agrobacterium leguminum]|uniref:Lipoyl-binding domain-containing protein n=1 Tax=Agrobacterium leguminum TaxID=2792015 RepID=A0A9X3KGP0_9HYPH|nr:biotin/lipoyl-containing protein [Agrobacterium leguminum]MCZ7911430.1 hypothetical protein [Agrobacterium leguminum]
MRDGARHRNGLGNLADPKLIEKLSDWLEASGLYELEIRNADGQSLVLVSGGSRYGGKRQAVETATIKAPFAGHFLIAGDFAVGRSVEASEVIGQIEIGPLRLPLSSPSKGVVREIKARSGELVGYGTALFTVEPMQ